MKRIISIWILLLCAGISKVQAQNDATLAGMILVYTNKAEKELKNQEKVMLMQTTGHVWTKEEVEGTTDLQREFNNYLNSFRSIVCYAARRFGLIRLIWISIYRITYQVIRTAVFHIVPPSQKCSIIPRVPRISSTEQIVKCFGRTDTLISRTRRCIVGSKNPVQSIPRIIRRSGKIQLEDRFRRILHMVYKKIGITALQ